MSRCCHAATGSDTSDDSDGRSDPFEDSAGESDDGDGEKLRPLDPSVAREKPPVRAMMLPMLCVFQGYACMVGPAQQKFKAELGIGQTGELAATFTQAAVFVHYGKLVARLGHDVVLGCISPMKRVYLSMICIFVGTVIPPLFVFNLHCHWIGTVFISYGLSGIGLGVFECTFLNVITPLGKLTKAWAIMGIPMGFGIVNILGLLCTSAGMPVSLLYWYIVALVPIGMLVLKRFGPGSPNEPAGVRGRLSSSSEQRNLGGALRDWKLWLPLMIPHIMAKVTVNFVMENATPVNYYTYNAGEVPLWGPEQSDPLVPHDLYFAILGIFVLLGDALSRRATASLETTTKMSNALLLLGAVLCSAVGFYLESLARAFLAWWGIFFAFWGNGMVYGASAKYIDNSLPKEYNLAAYSFWCFMGDLGGIFGGVTVDIVRNWICEGRSYTYECVAHN